MYFNKFSFQKLHNTTCLLNDIDPYLTKSDEGKIKKNKIECIS